MADAVALALDATLQRANLLMELAVALATRDLADAARAERALPPAAVPPSVAAALRELRGATVDPAPERVVVPSAEWVPSVGDFGAPPARQPSSKALEPVGASWVPTVPSGEPTWGPPPQHTCTVCGSSWLGAGECPDAELHSVWVASRDV